MPATSDEEVYDFEGNMERAFYEFLDAQGIDLATANDPQRLGDDYIGVQVMIMGVDDDEHMSEKPSGDLEYDHYLFNTEITIHTDRQENAVPSASFSRYHRELVAKVRHLLSISRAANTASLNDSLDLYWINRLVPSETNYIPYEGSYDETVLTFEGDFSVLTTAWPEV